MTPAERDLVVRTVLGEAADQPPEGQAAVAHVIMNRLKSGKFGDNLKRVILQPNAFEPWSTRAGELVSIPRNGEPYQAVAQLVDAVEKGDVPDPTKGATYFMNEDIVKKRNAGRVPQAWAQGPGLKIGDHTFFKPEAKTETPDYLSIFEKRVSEPRKTETQPSATAETVSAPVDYLSLFEKQAKGPAKTEAAAVPDTLPIVPPENMTPEQRAEYDQNVADTAARASKSALQRFDEAIQPTKVIPDAAAYLLEKTKEGAAAGLGTIGKAFSSPTWLPSYKGYQAGTPGYDKMDEAAKQSFFRREGRMPEAPKLDIDPGIIAGGIAGLLGMASGPFNAGAEQLEKLTGNKEFGEKAMMLVPGVKGARVANEMRPSVTAFKEISNVIPDKYLPEALATAERNPSLSLVDISQTARNRADMIARDPLAPQAQKAVLDFVENRKGELAGDLQSAVEVLGELPTPYSVVSEIKARAARTGKEVIEPFVQKAKDANITPIINEIDDVLAKADKSKLKRTPLHDELAQLRYDLRGDRNDRDQMFMEVKGDQGLHWAQAELRRKADDLLHSSVGSERSLGGKLMEYRQKLVDAIDAANPGYKERLKQFRTDKEVDRAFDIGLNIDKRPGKTSESILEHSPEAIEKRVKTLGDGSPEILAERLGALSWMAQEMESMKGGKKLMDSPRDRVLQKKIKALFGDDVGQQYLDVMRDTHRKAQTATELGRAGSQTFQRGREAEASPIRVPGARNPTPGTLQALGMLGAGAVAESIPLLQQLAGHGSLSAIGLGAAAARAGYSGLKYGFEKARYKSDLARRMAEAKLLTRPLGEQPDLLALMRQKRDAVGNDSLLRLSPPPLLQALPR